MPNIRYSKFASETHPISARGAEPVLQFRRHVMTVAPSNRITRALTGMLAASIVTAGIALLSPPSSAQQSPAAAPTQDSGASSSQPAATPGAASSGFQSQGIKATITSIALADKKITIQFIIQNTRQSSVSLAVVGDSGGSAGTLMATNGAIYKINQQSISGLPSCYNKRFPNNDQVAFCLKEFDEQDMTIVEAGQTGILGIVYDFNGSGKPAGQSDNANFTVKFLVRSAPGHEDTLSAAAGGKAGQPGIVTISFPLIPLSSQ
jgi:hypothetical protein